MNKVLFFLLALLFSVNSPSLATDRSTNEVISWMNITPKTTKPEGVTSLLGKPLKIEEGKKRTFWYYNHGNDNIVISWNNKSDLLEKFSFTCESHEKNTFDNRLQGKLKSGITDIIEAIKLLGIPKDMTIKSETQELHYTYQNSVLRLFFRNRTLVDFTLLTQQL